MPAERAAARRGARHDEPGGTGRRGVQARWAARSDDQTNNGKGVGSVVRRPVVWVAWVAAAVVLVEAVVLVAVAALLSRVVGAQHMSLAGLKPSAMSLGAWVGCGIAALFLLVCAVVLARTARRDQAPNRVGRVLLIVCAVLHGLLGALASALLGWGIFAAMMVGLGLLVWVLLGYDGGAGGGRSADGASHPQLGEGHVQFKEKPAE